MGSVLVYLFTLTPNNPVHGIYEGNTEVITGRLFFWGWYMGSYGWYSRAMYSYTTSGSIRANPPYMFFSETLETLHARDRLLLMNQMKDYSSDTYLGAYWRQNSVRCWIRIPRASGWVGRQILVKFDVEAYRPNEVQLFQGWDYKETYSVNNRRQFGTLLVVELEPGESEYSATLILDQFVIYKNSISIQQKLTIFNNSDILTSSFGFTLRARNGQTRPKKISIAVEARARRKALNAFSFFLLYQ